MKCFNRDYDVVLSFAGEDRKYVEKVAENLIKNGVRVFYDMYEDTNLWGKDLYQHLDDVYQYKAKYAVLFISEHYKKKLWTNHELKSAQARAFSENTEYILPARFDNTEIPGLRNTIGYVSLNNLTPAKFAIKIRQKLGLIEPFEFIPKEINFVKQLMQEIYEVEDIEVERAVHYVFDRLKLTSELERRFLSSLILNTCAHDITEDFHQDLSYLQRVSDLNKDEILLASKNLVSLGFEYKILKSIEGCIEENNEYEREVLHLKMISLQPSLVFENLTLILFIMYYASYCNRCESCRHSALIRLDFSDLRENAEDNEIEELLRILSFSECDYDLEEDDKSI